MRAWAVAISLFLIVIGGRISRADRDIVFSAQFYRWSNEYYKYSNGTSERCLNDVGMNHIYRINPDGSGLTRITSSRSDDFDPLWSPDGQRILFCRGRNSFNNTIQLLVMGADGRNIKRLATFHRRELHSFRYEWSPDGRKIAVHYKEGGFDTAPVNHMLILDSRSGRKLKVLNSSEFAWSPDGNSIYLSRLSGDSILNLATGKTRQLRQHVIRPIWVTRYGIVGFKPGYEDYADFGNALLRQLDIHNQSVSDMSYLENGEDERPFGGGPYGQDWYFLYSDALLALQLNHGVSDGIHSATYIINRNTGFWKHVIDRPTVAASPDGWQLLVTTHEWVGPYKRGGRRCGPLEIVDAATLKRRKITTKLVTVGGGDWRGKRRRTVKSYSFR